MKKQFTRIRSNWWKLVVVPDDKPALIVDPWAEEETGPLTFFGETKEACEASYRSWKRRKVASYLPRDHHSEYMQLV